MTKLRSHEPFAPVPTGLVQVSGFKFQLSSFLPIWPSTLDPRPSTPYTCLNYRTVHRIHSFEGRLADLLYLF